MIVAEICYVTYMYTHDRKVDVVEEFTVKSDSHT